METHLCDENTPQIALDRQESHRELPGHRRAWPLSLDQELQAGGQGQLRVLSPAVLRAEPLPNIYLQAFQGFICSRDIAVKNSYALARWLGWLEHLPYIKM